MRQILCDLRTRSKVLIACHSCGRTTVFIFIVKSLQIHIDIQYTYLTVKTSEITFHFKKFEDATFPEEVAWVLEVSCTKPRQDPRALQIQMENSVNDFNIYDYVESSKDKL